MNDLQSCDLCFQSVGPFYSVRILPATPLDFCGGTATPPHARVAGEQKIACHHCRYNFSNLELYITEEAEEPASDSENESPVPAAVSSTPAVTESTSYPSGLRLQPVISKCSATFPTPFYRYLVGEKASQRTPPHYSEAVQIYLYSSRAPPCDWLLRASLM